MVASFLETIIAPIPIELVLIPYMISHRRRIWRTATVVLLGCVAAALVGYGVGALFMQSLGQWVIDYLGWQQDADTLRQWFETWGFWAVIAVGVVPVSFQVAMLTAGAAGYPLLLFRLQRPRRSDFDRSGSKTGIRRQRKTRHSGLQRCHGPWPTERHALFPSLSGHYDRACLLEQPDLWNAGTRGGTPMADLMHKVIPDLDGRGKQALAAYYAALPPKPTRSAMTPKRADWTLAASIRRHAFVTQLL